MSEIEVKSIMHEGWIRTILQVASIIFLAGVGWARMDSMDTRIQKLESSNEANVSVQVGHIQRLTAIETKLDFMLAQRMPVAEAASAPPPRRRKN